MPHKLYQANAGFEARFAALIEAPLLLSAVTTCN